jgi:hypothetical protein
MQIYGLSSRYSAAIKKAKIVGRPELSSQEMKGPSGGDAESMSESMERPKVSRHGLSALLRPDDPSLHRQIAHQAGNSYSDEARISQQISSLRRTLVDIRNLQNISSQLGPAVYA